MDDLNLINNEIQAFSVSESYACDPEHCKNYIKNNMSLKILHVNIRSINKNFCELELLLDRITTTCDIIVLSECWLSKAPNIPILDGFVSYKTTFTNQNDGIVVYVRDNLTHSVEETSVMEANSLTIKCNSDIAILAVYRPPSYKNCTYFINTLNNYLESLRMIKTVALIGDININISPDNTDPNSEEYLNALAFQGLLPGHLISTRNDSCLDHAMLKTDRNATTLVLNSTITDHFPVVLSCDFNTKRLCNPKRCRSKINEEAVVAEIENTDFTEILVSNDPEHAASALVEIISAKIKIHTTVLNIPSKKRVLKPWITPGLLKCIRNRDKLYKKHKKDSENVTKSTIYKRYRNFCNNLLKKLKREYEKNEFEKARSNPKATWEVIKKITNSKNIKHKPLELLGLSDNSQNSVNLVNRYFSNVGKNLASKIAPLHTISPYGNPILSNINSMGLLDVDTDEVSRVIMALKINSAVGWDGISCSIIKAAKNTLAPVITRVINLCFSQSIVPLAFKKALVHPVYKSGDRDSVDNYRPISVLTTFSKIFEKCLNYRLTNYLNKYKILSDNQHGFRGGRSTEDAVLEFTDNVVKNIDKKIKAIGVFLDLSKAFDTVSVPLLIDKLEAIGIRGPVLELFSSYLTNRSQRVVIDNVVSTDEYTSYGVPQGSVLGPTLFLIYVNDLCQLSTTNCKILAYADDTALLVTGKTWDDARAHAEYALHIVSNWLSHNLLTLNVKKTNYVTLSPTISSQPSSDFYIKLHTCNINAQTTGCNCSALDRTDRIKYLGVLIDATLSWKPQIFLTSNKIRKLIYIFKKLRLGADYQTLQTVYYALAQSVISYCIAVWGGAPKTSLIRLERAQRALLKVMHFKPMLFPTEELYLLSGVMSVRKIFLLNITLRVRRTQPNEARTATTSRRVKSVFTNRPCRTVLAFRHFLFLSPTVYNRINKTLCIHLLPYNKCKNEIKKWLSNLNYDETEEILKIKN